METNQNGSAQTAGWYPDCQKDEIVEALFSLEEPWRTRFLELTAQAASSGRWNERGKPSPEQIAVWLEEPNLRRALSHLLLIWRRDERRNAER